MNKTGVNSAQVTKGNITLHIYMKKKTQNLISFLWRSPMDLVEFNGML